MLNMSDSEQKAGFDLNAQGFPKAKISTLLSTDPGQQASLRDMTLQPFGVYIEEVSK